MYTEGPWTGQALAVIAVLGAALSGEAWRSARGSEDRAAQRTDPRIVRAALDRWNSDKRVTWNDIASEFGFVSEPAAMNAVRRYAEKHGLVLRFANAPNEESRRQEALDLRLAGVSEKQIAHRLGYKATSVRAAIDRAQRTRRLDELYGREKNPLRPSRKPKPGRKG